MVAGCLLGDVFCRLVGCKNPGGKSVGGSRRSWGSFQRLYQFSVVNVDFSDCHSFQRLTYFSAIDVVFSD